MDDAPSSPACTASARFPRPRSSHTIRTLIAEPAALTREGLVALLGREKDIELIATVQRGEEAIARARELRPDVAVIAASFPDHDGIPIARALSDTLPACHCAILSIGRHPSHLKLAMAAQLPGYLVHDCAAEFLTEAVRQLAMGNKVIDPSLAYSMLGTRSCPLTLRETEVLRVASKGFTTADIATSLCLTVGTVRNYLSRAIAKVGARNRVDAIRIADESGWL